MLKLLQHHSWRFPSTPSLPVLMLFSAARQKPWVGRTKTFSLWDLAQVSHGVSQIKILFLRLQQMTSFLKHCGLEKVESPEASISFELCYLCWPSYRRQGEWVQNYDCLSCSTQEMQCVPLMLVWFLTASSLPAACSSLCDSRLKWNVFHNRWRSS